MNTTLTIKMEKKLRDEAKKTAKRMGIPLTTAVNVMVQKFVRDGVLVLEAECPFPSHTPNAETREAVLEGRSKRNGKTFTTVEEFKRYMATL
jgi:addiction module RelB/DinJ family antitoxin